MDRRVKVYRGGQGNVGTYLGASQALILIFEVERYAGRPEELPIRTRLAKAAEVAAVSIANLKSMTAVSHASNRSRELK